MYVVSLWKTTTALEKRLGVDSCVVFRVLWKSRNKQLKFVVSRSKCMGFLPLGDFPFMEGIDL